MSNQASFQQSGDFGGNITISLLEVDILAEHHGSMFVCEAKNEALGQSVHNAMTISVNCELQDSLGCTCGKIGGSRQIEDAPWGWQF